MGHLGPHRAPVLNPSVFKVLTPEPQILSRGLGILGAFLRTLSGEATFWHPWDHLGGPLARLGVPLGGLGGSFGSLRCPFGGLRGLLEAFFAILLAAFGVDSDPLCVIFAPGGLSKQIFHHFSSIFNDFFVNASLWPSVKRVQRSLWGPSWALVIPRGTPSASFGFHEGLWTSWDPPWAP